MNTCKLCPSDELVYSGVDAFLLGVPTETYCYDCANHIARQNQESGTPDYLVPTSTTSC